MSVKLDPRTTPAEIARLIAGRPGLWIANYAHDGWCKTLRTGRASDCNCSPDIELVDVGAELARLHKVELN